MGSSVIGGSGAGAATVTDNHVTILETNTGNVGGSIQGGWGANGTVSFNTVTIQGAGNVNAIVYGGNATNNGTVTDNTVYIGRDSSSNGTYSGTVTGNVYGGYSSSGNANNNYAATHFGLGYHWKLTKQNGLDFYAQYLWSRQNADTAELTTGETVKFEKANSERLRLGSCFVYAFNPHRRAFAGIAWEHEFDGKANASIAGYRVDTPKLTGDTCKLELGLTLQPTKTCPLTRNFGIQGYTGKREGVAGSVEVKYEL